MGTTQSSPAGRTHSQRAPMRKYLLQYLKSPLLNQGMQHLQVTPSLPHGTDEADTSPGASAWLLLP